MCGFKGLTRDEKLVRAEEVLNDTEYKQAVCNEILGASFRDIERVMQGIIEEKKPSREELEQLELEDVVPEKFDPAPVPTMLPPLKRKAATYSTYSPEDIQRLLKNN